MCSSTGHLDLPPARLCRRGKHGTRGLGEGTRAQLFPPTVWSQTTGWLWAGHTLFLPGWQLGQALAPKMLILHHAVLIHATLPWVP